MAIRALLLGVAASALLASGAAAGTDSAAASITLSEEEALELRIVELRLRARSVLQADVFAYELDEALYLPLGDMLLALDFPIDVDPQALTARGWFLRESQTFDLDGVAGTVSVAGRTGALAAGSLRTDGQALFVRADILSDWFRLNLDWSPLTQSVDLTPDYLLPAEEYASRARRSGFGGGSRGPRLDLASLEPLDTPYRWADWPHGTLDARVGFGGDDGQSRSSSLNFGLRGDLLKMTGELFASLSDTGEKSARLTLGRRDVDGGLFAGMLAGAGATAFRIGDVVSGTAPLLTASATGLGVSIERRSPRRSDVFDRTRLEGEAPPGWQAELYRDGALLGFVEVGAGGLYAFEDVPLQFGVNRFRIELYGPAGERDSISQTVDISNAFIQPGEIEYSFDAILPGKGVFRNPLTPVEQSLEDDEPAPADPGFAGDGYMVRGDMGFGLSQTVSGLFGFQLRGDDDRSAFTGLASAARRSGASILSGAVAFEDDGGVALEAGYSTEVRGVSVTGRGQSFSEDFGFAGEGAALRDQVDLRLDGRWEPGFLKDLAVWSLGARTARQTDGRRSSDISARLSGRIAGLSVSQSAFWRRDDGESGAEDRLTASTAVSGMAGPWRLRAGLDADLQPDGRLRTSRAEVSRRAGDWFFRAGLTRDMINEQNAWTLSASRDFNGVNFGLDVRKRDDGEAEAVLALRLAFDRDPSGRGVRLGRNARSQSGIATVRVFEDRDLDGTFSDGDVALPDAGLIVEPRARVRSDGSATVVDDMALDRTSGVAVDADTLPDPYLTPSTAGVRFSARPAGRVAIDLPVVLSGEVELTLTDASGEPLNGRIASLTPCDSADGEGRLRERSAFDGLVVFQFVRPGCYVVAAPDRPAETITLNAGEVLRLGDGS